MRYPDGAARIGTGTIIWSTAVRDDERLRLPLAQQLGSTGQHILSVRLDGAPVGDDVRLTFDSLRIEPDSGEPITVAVTYELELLPYPPT